MKMHAYNTIKLSHGFLAPGEIACEYKAGDSDSLFPLIYQQE